MDAMPAPLDDASPSVAGLKAGPAVRRLCDRRTIHDISCIRSGVMAHSTLQTPLTAAHAGVAQAERTLREVQALERQRRAERHEVEDTIRRAQTAGDAEALAPL